MRRLRSFGLVVLVLAVIGIDISLTSNFVQAPDVAAAVRTPRTATDDARCLEAARTIADSLDASVCADVARIAVVEAGMGAYLDAIENA